MYLRYENCRCNRFIYRGSFFKAYESNHKNSNTPQDLVELFKIIEPEESYHAKSLEEIATKYGMNAVKHCHDKGLKALSLKMV